jgi:hypothetical protein
MVLENQIERQPYCSRRFSRRSGPINECSVSSALLLPVLPAALLSNSLWTAIHAGYDQLPKPVLNAVLR